MADALISPAVAVTAGAVSLALILKASSNIRRNRRTDLTPMMGVMGAFVFAAQMINFTIPGTGSSGHIIGGVLLAAILGPWAAFLTLSSVLIVQCLVFADGGLMALGCNILNMAATSCLVAWPLVYKPIVGTGRPSTVRLTVASVAACIVGLELGALLVSVETCASGVTALPFASFVAVMLPIHLVIGACEGVATAVILTFVLKNSPSMLVDTLSARHMYDADDPTASTPQAIEAMRRVRHRRRVTLAVIGALAVVFAVTFTWIASSHPDGLEWSIQKLTGATELAPAAIPATAVIPDYESYFAGVIGALIVMAILWSLSALVFRRRPVTKHQG